MQASKTHEQQMRIIEGREKTKTPEGFEDTALHRPKRDDALHDAKPASGEGPDLSTGDRTIKRGANQETEHAKHRVDE